jgi:cytochrome c oxidase assembly protein subunit 15
MYRIIALRRLALATMLLALGVIVFGAYVRLSDAGLGCPDWPGCYGHFSPPDAEGVHAGKAWREMIHRYAAGTLGFLIVVIAVLAWRWRRQGIPVALPAALVGLVMFQGLLGMWTVTLLLKPLIVTLHLIFGLATLSLLWWLWLTLRRRSSDPWSGARSALGGGSTAALLRPAPRFLQRLATIALVALVIQIMLGGWTSTNYAAVACPDFPKCQLSWWPQADFGEAFVIWRGLGINYEGGVLDHPARVAIHFTHRLGALVATLALLAAVVMTLRTRRDGSSRFAAVAALAALAFQLAIGIFMVLKGFPLSLATAHNFGAALLLLATLALNRALRRA